ncbi:MAG: 50S ribosomal protein L30 [bacterium]|nr:50S ribosomal protein L30 [bacterium]
MNETATPAKKLRITQTRSQIGYHHKQKRILAGLGLGRIGRAVVRIDHPSIRGMVNKIPHLVKVEEVEG